MTIEACAELVRRGDPDRFLSALTAPPEMRGRLMVLYAFNLEVARAPWVTAEPMIAEMRLQWWQDVLDEIELGKPPRAHEVAGPLSDLGREVELETSTLKDLVAARQFDIYRDPPENTAAFQTYIERTSGGLMWAAAASLGAPDTSEITIREFGSGGGVAQLLRAVPALKDAGRMPLFDPRPTAIKEIAKRAQQRMAIARLNRALVPGTVRAALLAVWQADQVLRSAIANPALAGAGGLETSEFRRRSTLAWRNFTGRW